MNNDITEKLLKLQQFSRPPDFSGFGLVVYTGDIEQLSVSPLLREGGYSTIADYEHALDFLFTISRYGDIQHDGFHFLHRELGLTHIAQFFSPPIPVQYSARKYGVGARYRAAELASLLINVTSVYIFQRTGMVTKFHEGNETIYACK